MYSTFPIEFKIFESSLKHKHKHNAIRCFGLTGLTRQGIALFVMCFLRAFDICVFDCVSCFVLLLNTVRKVKIFSGIQRQINVRQKQRHTLRCLVSHGSIVAFHQCTTTTLETVSWKLKNLVVNDSIRKSGKGKPQENFILKLTDDKRNLKLLLGEKKNYLNRR